MHLRVMSFNIHGGIGVDRRLDLERVARTIEDSGVDVVGLQEVHRHFSPASDFVDQAGWLAGRLNMQLAFGANVDRDRLQPNDPRRQYGTATLSRYSILEQSNTHLPKRPRSEQRGLLRIRIAPGGIPLRVYNTHLQHDSVIERRTQVAAIRQLIGDVDEPMLLVGDFNATPESLEIRHLTADLIDVWPSVGFGPGCTYDAQRPRSRIDYVLISRGGSTGGSTGIAARSARVVASAASDHLPVVVDLALPTAKGMPPGSSRLVSVDTLGG